MERRVSLGIVGLTALAVAGNFIIALPVSKDDGSDILGVLLAVGVSFLLFLFGYPLLCKFLSLEISKIRRRLKPLYAASLVLIMGMIVLIAVSTLTEFARFSFEAVLPKTGLGLIFTAILLTALFIASKSFRVLSKMGMLFFVLCILLSVIIFLLSIGDMSLKYVTPRDGFNLKGALSSGGAVFISAFAEAFLLVSAVSDKASGTRSVLFGNLGGAALVILCSLNTLLVFGGGLASRLSYPYVSAVKAVGTGEVFSGMEGFLYVSIFFCCTVKCAIAFFGIKNLGQRLFDIKNFN